MAANLPLSQPLLDALAEEFDAAPEDASAVAPGPGAGDPEEGKPSFSVATLRGCTPEQALSQLREHGVRTLGQLTVVDSVLKLALGDDGDDLLTQGADSAGDFDWRAAWARALAIKPKRQLRKGWTSSVVALARVVAVEGATAPGAPGLLQTVIKRYQVSGDASIFAIPAVEAIITFKWNAFARRLLRAEFIVYLVWLLSFTGFVWAIQDEDLSAPLSSLLDTPRGLASVCLEAVGLAAMLPFVYVEAVTLAAYGVWQWATLWNLIDTSTYGLQVLITGVHLTRSHMAANWFSVVLAAQCLLLWSKLQWFSRVFQSTTTSFVDTLKMVIYDVRYFLIFLMLTGYSFAASFHILMRKDQKQSEAFSTFLHTVGTVASGGPEMSDLWDTSVPTAATVLCMIYNFTMAVVLLNLLIALMSDSYSRIMEREESRFRCNQALMIDELEATLPPWAYPAAWAPRYVHFLQRADDTDGEDANADDATTLDDLRGRLERLESLVVGLEGRLLAALAPPPSVASSEVTASDDPSQERKMNKQRSGLFRRG